MRVTTGIVIIQQVSISYLITIRNHFIRFRMSCKVSFSSRSTLLLLESGDPLGYFCTLLNIYLHKISQIALVGGKLI
jgi:hypothetical protein